MREDEEAHARMCVAVEEPEEKSNERSVMVRARMERVMMSIVLLILSLLLLLLLNPQYLLLPLLFLLLYHSRSAQDLVGEKDGMGCVVETPDRGKEPTKGDAMKVSLK